MNSSEQNMRNQAASSSELNGPSGPAEPGNRSQGAERNVQQGENRSQGDDRTVSQGRDRNVNEENASATDERAHVTFQGTGEIPRQADRTNPTEKHTSEKTARGLRLEARGLRLEA